MIIISENNRKVMKEGKFLFGVSGRGLGSNFNLYQVCYGWVFLKCNGIRHTLKLDHG